MPLRPCIACRALTREGSYCALHRPLASPGKQRSGGKQQTFRRKTLQRYGLRCIPCGSTENVDAAHDMTPRQQATFEEAEAGIPLCRKCHRRIDAEARRARPGIS